jgi:hypothetical protein
MEANNTMVRLIFAPFPSFAVSTTLAGERDLIVTNTVTKEDVRYFFVTFEKTVSPRSYRRMTAHTGSEARKDFGWKWTLGWSKKFVVLDRGYAELLRTP